MTDPQALLAEQAAEVVGKLTGPDREVDCLIYADQLGDAEWIGNVLRAAGVNLGSIDPGEHSRNFTCWHEPTPRYTASLDAAMTLVPEGWRIADLGETVIEGDDPWNVRLLERRFDGRAKQANGNAATPALALTAACLRAILIERQGK